MLKRITDGLNNGKELAIYLWLLLHGTHEQWCHLLVSTEHFKPGKAYVGDKVYDGYRVYVMSMAFMVFKFGDYWTASEPLTRTFVPVNSKTRKGVVMEVVKLLGKDNNQEKVLNTLKANARLILAKAA